MAADNKKFPNSDIPIRKSSDLLPNVFQTPANDKFLSGVLDPLIQPGVVDKTVGYIGKRYGKTFTGKDVYLDTDQTLRSRYQLEPAVTVEEDQKILKFKDYIDLKSMVEFFGNANERDDKTTEQEHYSWNPPIVWDKFINYREYYWIPGGPPSIDVYGQAANIQSTYKVGTGINSWILTPDSVTNNPDITLYRGQEYKFEVNSPDEGFYIRNNYDTGSLEFNPNKSYFPGELAVFDKQLWKCVNETSPLDGSSITIDSQDWQLVANDAGFASLLYRDGVENNGVKVGTLTFKIPQDSPDILYYQSDVEPNRLGRFIISDIDTNTFIDVEKEVVGKKEYTTADGISFTNGMVVAFRGQVQPSKYADGQWLVEGVGSEIRLINFADLVPPPLDTDSPDILFDNQGFDTQPFDDATQYPGNKDYITIARNSKDSNPWSRYNRWFHRAVLESAYKFRSQDFDSLESARAKRPIIEFQPDIQLYNHGGIAKQTVDYVDTFTDDVFSKIEGSQGYNIDGEFLFEGARILVIADTDSLANNRIYEVRFVKHNNTTQINLKETADSLSAFNEGVLVRRGTTNAGKMYHYDGTVWKSSQEKTSANQAPKFELYDSAGVAFSDPTIYPVSSFVGSNLLSYKVGTGVADTELGFALSYANINNVGDIVFDWNFETEKFVYTLTQKQYTKNTNTGFYKINGKYANGWIATDKKFIQPIIDQYTFTTADSIAIFNTVDWDVLPDDAVINFYLNGEYISDTYTRSTNQFTFDRTFNINDVVTIKIVAEIKPDQGYYQIPAGLEKNPLNEQLKTFTLGQATDHLKSSLEFDRRVVGTVPGVSNLRDLDQYQKHSTRFMKHSGFAAVSTLLINDKDINIVKSLRYAKSAYTIFKQNIIKKATEVEFNENTSDFLDSIIEIITKTKTIDSPFADSDMIGAGAFTRTDYVVDDPGIKTFTLTEDFDLETLSRRAVYVYLNDVQLIVNKDYTVNGALGFITITGTLVEGDRIEIREYVSTAFSHVPPTPTSLGLYPKYEPTKYLDDTYRVPKDVIQGHDGSKTTAYGDYRDDLLLEFEKRVFNNIKQDYDAKIFDVQKALGGYYGNSTFVKEELDSVINQEFLSWVQNTNLGYTTNDYFVETEPFTYTYSGMTDPTGKENLPGYWRGVYKYFYDTDRPHTHPWEMLGFTIKPTWWETEYGAAPYTNGNLVLWEDIAAGKIAQGDRAGIYPRYARTTILNHIPCDCDGNLVDPLTSGLAGNFQLVNNRGPFKLGDDSPVENAWKTSSEYPFAITTALALLKPFDYLVLNFDRAVTKRNIIDQLVNVTSETFLTPTDLKFPIAGKTQVAGLAIYIASYIKSVGGAVADAQKNIDYINVRLTSRVSGFVDKQQQKYLLDSKNPSSASASVFIPPENYDIIFNVSSPIASVTYSGVIFEKTTQGWVVNGYDDINPYFNTFEAYPQQADPVISVAGTSEPFTEWDQEKTFNNGGIVEYRGTFYRATQTFTSGETFDKSNLVQLPDLPVQNAVVAQQRRNFNSFKVKKVSYGTEFNSIQSVVDFLLGYQAHLKSQGFDFANYDGTNQVVQDFTTAAKEFMYWTVHNWAVGSVLSMSPGAASMEINLAVGVADNLLDSFYDYNVLKADGSALDPKFINVSRSFQKIQVNTTNTTEGIYLLKLNYVLKEHVVVFDDKTVFNDTIFDKATGYRQERIKAQGFRTTDWDGDYTSPGFLFDNVSFDTWIPYYDYKLGDIVSYRAYKYTARFNHTSDEEFNDANWTQLDSTPEKQLIPNFDYRINQMEDYFDVSSEGLGKSQRDLARHTTGYQSREYLENLSEDPTTQFKLYQGFIREKGTPNAITKLFTKLGDNTSNAAVDLNEEWGFKLGQVGGVDQSERIEIRLDTDKFKLNPQPVLVQASAEDKVDRYYRIDSTNFEFGPSPFTTDINPTSYDSKPVLTAGYVSVGQTDFTVTNRDEILNLAIASVQDNNHIWVTFDGPSWTVLRANTVFDLKITNLESNDDNEVIFTFEKAHLLKVDDIFGIKTIAGLSQFWKVKAATTNTVTVQHTEKYDADQGFEPSTGAYPMLLTEARFSSYDTVDPEKVALLTDGSKLFVDSNVNSHWEVVEKKKQFTGNKIVDFGITDPTSVGKKTVYSDTLKQVIVGIPDAARVGIYIQGATGLSSKQLLEPPSWLTTDVTGSFGLELALSPDSQWLMVGAPTASGIPSRFQGAFDVNANYLINDIVLFAGRLYKATDNINGDGSTIDVYSNEWVEVQKIDAESDGSNTGGFETGVIFIYKYQSQQWNLYDIQVSPRTYDNERFGEKIAVSQVTSTGPYYMSVSAPGSQDAKGRVYLYTYDTTDGWRLDYNKNYRGIYAADDSTFYPKDSIVFSNGDMWKALVDNVADGSSLTIYSNDWVKMDEVTTGASLPMSIATNDDGSTLDAGILDDEQLVELVKVDDRFGTSLAMNYDGTVLAVGSPNSDGQYFNNFKGQWRPNYEYMQGDTVKYQGSYHQLQNLGPSAVGADSTIRSYNEAPDAGEPWVNVGDSTDVASGKVYIYKKNAAGVYRLLQQINADSLPYLSDLDPSEAISSGDKFGYAIGLDYSGNTLVVTSPLADKNFQNQGSAYVFKFDSDSTEFAYRLKQKLTSYSDYPNEMFGQDISISSGTEIIAIGATNSPFTLQTRFDGSQTSYDSNRTTFRDYDGFAGAVYVFEKKGKSERYFLSEKIDETLSLNESFGYSLYATRNAIVVGSPNYISPAPHGVDIAFEGDKTGTVRLFEKTEGQNALNVIGSQPQTVDIDKFKRISLYDTEDDIKILDIEIFDPAKMKLLAQAERELTYKVPYDPAIYTTGTAEGAVVDDSICWKTKNVGKLWWDISTAKWYDYEQGEVSYRVGAWGALAPGASIDVYEWVQSKLLPSEWAVVADTNEGLPLGISGQPLYADDSAYSIKAEFNPNTGEQTEVYYYYWVRNKVTVPEGNTDRSISAADVFNLISDPSALGQTYAAFIDKDKFLLFNYKASVAEISAVLNVEYFTQEENQNQVHNEYQLLTEGVADSLPTTSLENKWIDSLIGYDRQGNRIPDPNLPAKQRYGISYRPRQSMFVDRKSILRTLITNVNAIMHKEAFADSLNFTTLNSVDSIPSSLLNLYDTTVDSYIELLEVGTSRIKQCNLRANIIDNEVNSIDILDAGFGYKIPPTIEFEGDGTGAEAVTTIDNQGRVNSVTITNKGKLYTYISTKPRQFSVLVNNDSTANNFWSIYAWDDVRKSWYRSRSQAYNTPLYWSYADWWDNDFGPTSRIVKEIVSVYEEPTINVEIGDLIRIKEYGSGGWAVFKKTTDVSTESMNNYEMIGRYQGTIQFSSDLYDTATSGVGYDNVDSFDIDFYDKEVSNELRFILQALKEDVLTGNYAVEWNNLFFTSIRYVFKEQTYVDWAFKSSFLNATHNVGTLKQKTNYKNDSLESYLDYINEVKPYSTTVREYISKYNTIDNTNSAISDFDLPPYYSEAQGKIVPVESTDDILATYPYKFWNDNKGYQIIEISVAGKGADYTEAPKVLITGGGGSGAKATAYVSNGKVTGIKLTEHGSGYTSTPTVSLVGGNGTSPSVARAVAVLGNGKTRSINVNMKFDRISKTGIYSNFTQTESFTATGSTAVFNLTYPPTRDKSNISIIKDGQVVLNNEYDIALFTLETDEYKQLRGKITFKIPPAKDEVINITYAKNDEILDSVSRIEKYYNPSSGMVGKELNQLMTGIDFGGVQVQGTTFDVTGGWDALPWFTDSWDSVESAADYYYVADGSTINVTLPYTPVDGQVLNIYLKRAGTVVPDDILNLQVEEGVEEPTTHRIDDPNYTDNWDSSVSTNPHAQMPTFIGDGSTNIVEVGAYVSTQPGDILIFRPAESDGAVTINDNNLLDTKLSGGTLSAMEGAYATATGLNAEDISIDGGEYTSPDQVPATEENIPGQVLDSLSIKVFHSNKDAAGATVKSNIRIGDGSTLVYPIGQKILENKSVIVYIDGIKSAPATYTVNISNSTIEFSSVPAENSKIEIVSIGLGGVSILDYQEFIADGETTLFLTNANYIDTSNIFVSVNGVQSDTGFIDSTDLLPDTPNRTLVQFGTKPDRLAVIRIVAFGAAADVDSSLQSLIRVNQQEFTYDGSTKSYDLDTFVQLSRESALASTIVEVNNKKLKSVDTVYNVYDGVTKKYVLGVDPIASAGSIVPNNIKVYINNELKTFITDYVYNGTTKELEVTAENLTVGDVIKIENNLNAEYSVVGNNIVINDSTALTLGDTIDVTWFSEYPSMEIVSDQYTGGKAFYPIAFKPLGVSYVWVYRNKTKLIQDVDYRLDVERGAVYIEGSNKDTDSFEIVAFGSNVFALPSAYQVSKDMLNINRYTRYAITDNLVLAKELTYYDESITLADASTLFEPVAGKNIPGIIEIDGEKIEYMNKNGNVLSNLRRGTQGTAIKTLNPVGSYVVDLSTDQTIPYKDTQSRTDFVSDGSSQLIGPLPFVPKLSTVSDWYEGTIPAIYGRCDSIEVFVGGKRLRKTYIDQYNETKGSTSPAGDEKVEAEFSVDGSSAYIRLTNVPPAGTRISIIKQQGQVWYDRGQNTATSGVTLLKNSTPISQFIAANTSKLPE